MTFDDLNGLVNRLANRILQRTGTDREPIILLMDQRAWAVVGFLAILKAGKICVPANPVNNEARFLDTIIAEMKPSLLITCVEHMAVAQALNGAVQILDVVGSEDHAADLEPACASLPDDPAVVVYTSGSTATPKGVMHSHRNILHRVFWYACQFGIGEADRTMMLSAPDHISGVVGVLRSLLTGGRLHMLSIRLQGLLELGRCINEQGITILPIVNSVFRRFTDELAPDLSFSSLRLIIIGGEPAYLGDLQRFRRHFPRRALLINTLGCTELPTYRYFVMNHQTELPGGLVPAGYAVPGIETVIVGDDGKRVAKGEIGEIVVRSRYLALGYWNRPEDTVERFEIDGHGTRRFRTGDLGTIRDDGLLQHIGRKDWLIKILGNRVELYEVEAILRLHPDCRDVCVIAQRDEAEEMRLCAYIVLRHHSQPSVPDLKAFLRARLPDYMVPARFEFLADLPLNRSGKIDRRALESRKLERRPDGVIRESPRTDAERRIARICKGVLAMDEIGINENLFDLGANSLLAMMIVNRLIAEFEVQLNAALVFDIPTISGLAEFVSAHSEMPPK
jgi:amino acid adenylation domain-containing protein